jgi:hypothetical protein
MSKWMDHVGLSPGVARTESAVILSTKLDRRGRFAQRGIPANLVRAGFASLQTDAQWLRCFKDRTS